MLPGESETRCVDEGATCRDDRTFTKGHSGLVPEQAVRFSTSLQNKIKTFLFSCKDKKKQIMIKQLEEQRHNQGKQILPILLKSKVSDQYNTGSSSAWITCLEHSVSYCLLLLRLYCYFIYCNILCRRSRDAIVNNPFYSLITYNPNTGSNMQLSFTV